MSSEGNKGPLLGMRHVQSFLLFMDLLAAYISRWNVSVAVVAMTNAQNANPNFPEFDWNEKYISYIHSSFFWGYVCTQFPGGVLGKHFGSKIILGWSTLVTGLLSALTPWCVGWGGWQAFCTIRVVQGFSQGVIFPCLYVHVAKWSPLQERNRLGAFALSGVDCGTVLAMAMSGFIAKGPMGWPGIFYVSAGISFVWCLLWFCFAANSPAEAKFITVTEKQYIESCLPLSDDGQKKKIPIPWKAVFTSLPFLVGLIARCAYMWGLSVFAAQLPTYLNGVLNMEIKSNALFSALPFLASWLMTYVYMVVADIIQHRNILSLTALRRLFNSIAFWIPAAGLVGMGFLDEDNKNLALTLMTISVGLNSGNIIGCALNIIDLSPNHTGILYSVVNTLASLMSVISPLVVGVIVTEVDNRYQWQIVFGISAAIFFLGNLVYIIFGSTSVQPWDADDYLLPKDTESSNSVADRRKS